MNCIPFMYFLWAPCVGLFKGIYNRRTNGTSFNILKVTLQTPAGTQKCTADKRCTDLQQNVFSVCVQLYIINTWHTNYPTHRFVSSRSCLPFYQGKLLFKIRLLRVTACDMIVASKISLVIKGQSCSVLTRARSQMCFQCFFFFLQALGLYSCAWGKKIVELKVSATFFSTWSCYHFIDETI